MKLTPFCLKSFAVTTFTEREHQAIELVDHTHQIEGIDVRLSLVAQMPKGKS